MIKNSTFSENSSDGSGGAIYNAGMLSVKDSVFSQNCSSFGAGSAIANLGTVSIKNRSFLDNRCAVFGGAIFNAGALTVERSVFSGNSALSQGGAIGNPQHSPSRYGYHRGLRSPSWVHPMRSR